MNTKIIVALMVGFIGFNLCAKSPVKASCTTTVKGSIGTVSASTSKDGNKCGTVAGVTFCSNSKTGEKSVGVSGSGVSLVQGGKGSTGKNNFVAVKASTPLPVTPTCTVKVSTPTFTKAGMTSGSVKN
jgi:hypothetical protein